MQHYIDRRLSNALEIAHAPNRTMPNRSRTMCDHAFNISPHYCDYCGIDINEIKGDEYSE